MTDDKKLVMLFFKKKILKLVTFRRNRRANKLILNYISETIFLDIVNLNQYLTMNSMVYSMIQHTIKFKPKFMRR